MQTQQVDLYSDSESEVDRGEICGNIVWKGNQYPIYDGENIIGREDDCDVKIEHDSVSLKHAVLDFEDGVARMRDLKSKNGTSVESDQGSGSYTKLGPTKRNVEVNSGCKLRFGLVDCKYVAVKEHNTATHAASSAASAAPAKSALKYDCETQFLNVGLAADSDEEGSDGDQHENKDRVEIAKQFSLGSATSSLRSKASSLEAETQIDQGLTLNSAEKAPIPGAILNTPSSLIKTRFEDGIACMGSPISVRTTPGGVLSRTAASPVSSSSSTTPSRDLRGSAAAESRTPMTAVGGDECSTDDDLDMAEDDEGPMDVAVPNPYVPITLGFTGSHGGAHQGGVGAGTMGPNRTDTDVSEDDDDMSQDLMHAAEHESEAGDEGEGGAGDVDLATTPSQQPSAVAHLRVNEIRQQDVAGQNIDTDASDDEMSVDFKLAQEDSLSAKEVTDVETLVQEVVASPVDPVRLAQSTLSRSATGSRDGPPATSDSPFHNLATAGPFAGRSSKQAMAEDQHDRDTHMQVHEESEREVHSSVFFSAISAPEPLDEDAGRAEPFVPSMPSIPENRTASPHFDESDVQTTAQLAVEPALRSPGTVIKELLSNSGMPEGVKVFRSQGGLVDSYRTGSPSIASATSSYPQDVPVLAADDLEAHTMDVAEHDMAIAQEPEVGEPSAATTAAPVKATKGRTTKKRFIDDAHDEEGDTSATAVVEAPSASKSKKARFTTTEMPVQEEPAATASEGVGKPAAGRKGKANAAAADTVPVPEPELEPVPAEDVKVVEAAGKPAGKRGKGKVVVPLEESPVVTDTNDAAPAVVADVAVKGAKKGKSKAASVELVETPIDAPGEPMLVEETTAVVEPLPAKATVKRGRGKQVPAEAEPPADGVHESAAVMPEPPAVEVAVVAQKGTKKPTKKSATAATEEPEPERAAAAESAPVKGPSSKTLTEEFDTAVNIMFTKVDEAPYAKFLKGLTNATVTSDATIATHCVTLPELKRTPKLMVAINCGVKYVVTEQWIKDSVKAKALLAVTDGAPPKKGKASKSGPADPRADADLYQQLTASPYIVQDADKEKLWGFNMATTLAVRRNQLGAARLFDGLCFFCTKGVCGETAPPADELRTIIESGGGVWLNSLDEWNAYSDADGGKQTTAAAPKGKNKVKSSAADDTEAAAGSPAAHSLVVLSHPNVVKKEVTKKVLEAVAKGSAPASGVYSMELVFLACLKQRVEFDDHRLK